MPQDSKNRTVKTPQSTPVDDIRLGQLETACRKRGDIAKTLLDSDCQVACYLSHVALECAMKARALSKDMVQSRSQLEQRRGKEYADQLFSGRRGHDLSHLAKLVVLQRLLAAERRSDLLQSDEWQRMTSSARPYSLRYGTEQVDLRAAKKEIQLGETLRTILEASR